MSNTGKKQQDKPASRKPKDARVPVPEEAQGESSHILATPPALERLSGKPGAQRLRQATLLQMQRKLGNAYVLRVLEGRQSKGPSIEDPSTNGAELDTEVDGRDGEANSRSAPAPAVTVQRADENSGDEPTEAEKKAAKQRAKVAAAQAAQTAAVGKQSVAESKNLKKSKAQEKQAAKTTKKQADSAAKSKAGKPLGKKGAGGPSTQKGPAKQGGPELAAVGPEGESNGAGPGEKAPSSPEEDAGFNQVVKKAKQTGSKEKGHEKAAKKAQQAQKAAVQPPQEKSARAQSNKVAEMAAAETPGFDKAAFKSQLMSRIAAMAPRTTKEADNFKGSGKLGGLKGEMKGKVAQEKKKSQGPVEQKVKEAPDPASVPDKPTEPAPPLQAGPPPPALGAEMATPKKKTAHEVEKPLEQDSQKLDQQMEEADITEEQLANSNEPEFVGALDQKKEAQAHAKESPKTYREAEEAEITTAQTEAAATTKQKTQGMHDQRSQLLEQVGGEQANTKTKDEGERAKVAAEMQKIYTGTKTKVETILGSLDGKVNQAFDSGAESAKRSFENYVDSKMEAYKEDRYGGWFGWAKWAKDKLLGMPSKVNAFYTKGRELYLKEMDAVIDHVVEIIAKDLAEAKAEVARGRQAIQDYLTQLPEDLQKVGADAAQAIQDKFQALEESVDNKQGELIDSLANKYSENLQAIDARIDELKAANRGLVDKVVDAVKGVINTIMELKDMLLGVMSRVADVVGKIIKAPVKFLGNLIGAVKQGFNNFVGNITTHLKKGFMGWLTGSIADAGIDLPETFDLKGIFQLVMQLLGLTMDKMRERISGALGFDPFAFYDQIMGIIAIYQEEGLPGLAKAGLSHILGPEKLEALMEVIGIVKLVQEGDFGALFDIVQGKLADLKEIVFDKIQEYLIERVIKSAITWLIGLFNPVGAFIKAAKMIYDVIMFFVERGKQIMELINAIVDSVGAIVSGNISGAAKMVENALAKSIPVAISFLASLLGLGGISEKVREIIEAVRHKVDGALTAVFESKPVQMVGGFIRKVVGKVKNVAEKGVGKVKDLAASGAGAVKGAVSAGAGKVKGAVTAGVGKVKSGVASGADKLKDSLGMGEEKPKSTAAGESEQSTAVKGKARELVNKKAKKPFQSQQEANETLGAIKKRLEPQGLKSLHLRPRNGQLGKFDVIAEASPEEDVGDITVEIPSALGVSRRIDSVEEAQKVREQWIIEGKGYRESLSTKLFQEEWAVGLQQEGKAPPAYVDSGQTLNIDVSRVGWMSTERSMELQSIRQAGKGSSGSPAGTAPAAPTATRETKPPMSGASDTPTMELPAADATKRETESSVSDTVEMPAVGGTKPETASSMADTAEMPAVESTTSAETGPYGLRNLDPAEAGIAGTWLKQRPPKSGGGPVKIYRGFARNAEKYMGNVLRAQDVGSGGYLTRDPGGAHDAVYNRVGREPVLKGENQGGVVALTIPGDLWDALVDNNHISERPYPGYSGGMSSSELRVNSQKARQLINSCGKKLLPPDPTFDKRPPSPEDLLKLYG